MEGGEEEGGGDEGLEDGSMELKAAVPWSSLPVDLLIEIAGGFDSFTDLYAFRAVCCSWRAATLQIRRPLSFRAPLLTAVACSDDRIDLYDPARGVFFHYPLGCSFRFFDVIGSSYGFLVITAGNFGTAKIVLVNIVTGVRLHLPEIHGSVHKVVLSESPMSSACTVACYCQRPCTLLFCRVGDRCWTHSSELEMLSVDDILFAHGALYALAWTSNNHHNHLYSLVRIDLFDGTSQKWTLNMYVNRVNERVYLALAEDALLLLHFMPGVILCISSWEVAAGRFIPLKSPLEVALFCGNWSFVKSVVPTVPICDTDMGRRFNYHHIKPNHLYLCRTYNTWWQYSLKDSQGQLCYRDLVKRNKCWPNFDQCVWVFLTFSNLSVPMNKRGWQSGLAV